MSHCGIACDRCYTPKEKRATDDLLPCLRCAKLRRRCVTSGQQIGRPRTELKSTFTSSLATNNVVCASHASSSIPSAAVPGPGLGQVSLTTRNRQLSGNTSSNGGSSLSGPSAPAPAPASAPSASTPLMQRPSNPILATMNARERCLFEGLFDKRGFICRFIMGASFVDPVLGLMFVGLQTAPTPMRTGLLACSSRYLGRMATTTTVSAPPTVEQEVEDGQNNARAACSLYDTAARAAALQERDLLYAAILAIGLITYDLLDAGLQAQAISRFTLRLVNNFYRCSPAEPSPRLNLALVPLIFHDTCNCVVRRGLPVRRLDVRDGASTADRYLGVCIWLLPHLYDICILSHELGAGTTSASAAALALAGAAAAAPASTAVLSVEWRAQAIQSAVLAWRPQIPEAFVAHCTETELEIIRIQAEVFRYTTLLLLHRVRFSFGERNDAAQVLATTVLANISRLFRHARSVTAACADKVGHPVDGISFEYRMSLPFLVAAVEAENVDERRRLLGELRLAVCERMYPVMAAMLTQFLISVWQARDNGFRGSWFDLVPNAPRFVLF